MIAPKVGDYLRSARLGWCEVTRIHRAGTVDVRQVETDKYFRISGLGFVDASALGSVHPAPGSNEPCTLIGGVP